MAIVLQPTASIIARKHFKETIIKGVKLESVKKYLDDEDYEYLCEKYSDGIAHIWGIKNGKINKIQYGKLCYDETVLFVANKKIYLSGKIVLFIKNEEMAKQLWGVDKDGTTWSNTYFVCNLNEQDINVEDFNIALGYNQNAKVRGFYVLDDDQSDIIENTFDL